MAQATHFNAHTLSGLQWATACGHGFTTHVCVTMSDESGVPAVHGPHGGAWHSSSRVHDIGLSGFGALAGSP